MSFKGFEDELNRVSGGVGLVQRQSLCAAGVQTLYVAVDDSGDPIYAQWLVRSDEQEALHRATHGLFPQLVEGEALVEGAYTFANFRKLGAMTDGMRQSSALGTAVTGPSSRTSRSGTFLHSGDAPASASCLTTYGLTVPA